MKNAILCLSSLVAFVVFAELDNPLFAFRAAQYGFDNWRGTTHMNYGFRVPFDWRRIRLGIETNSACEVKRFPYRANDLLAFNRALGDEVVMLRVYICSNVVDAQEMIISEFCDWSSMSDMEVATNSIGDRCYYHAKSNVWQTAVYSRNNVCVSVCSDPGFVSAETIARAIDNDILLFMRTNSPAGGNE